MTSTTLHNDYTASPLAVRSQVPSHWWLPYCFFPSSLYPFCVCTSKTHFTFSLRQRPFPPPAHYIIILMGHDVNIRFSPFVAYILPTFSDCFFLWSFLKKASVFVGSGHRKADALFSVHQLLLLLINTFCVLCIIPAKSVRYYFAAAALFFNSCG